MLKKEDIKIVSKPDYDRMERHYRASLNLTVEGAVSEYAAHSISGALSLDAMIKENLTASIFNKLYGELFAPINELYHEAMRSPYVDQARVSKFRSEILSLITPAK